MADSIVGFEGAAGALVETIEQEIHAAGSDADCGSTDFRSHVVIAKFGEGEIAAAAFNERNDGLLVGILKSVKCRERIRKQKKGVALLWDVVGASVVRRRFEVTNTL